MDRLPPIKINQHERNKSCPVLAAIRNQIPEDDKHDSNYYIYVRLQYLSLIKLLHSFTQLLAWWRSRAKDVC